MADEIRTDAIVTLRHAAEVNNAEANRCRADADKMQADANELRARAGWFTAMADRWDRIATFIENGTFDLDYLLSGDDLGEARRAAAAQVPLNADAEAPPACARCKVAFDPDDKAFDGAAEALDTGFCNGCIDNCHEGGVGHRCVICVPRDTESGS